METIEQSIHEYLAPDELERIERENPGGVTARAIVEIFRPRGARLSEATFRKYVQSGLLPRSRRVGRKGKHRGSQGLYPVEAVRRINVIKKMMDQGLTLEEIRRSFLYFKNHIDEVERGLRGILDGLESELRGRVLGEGRRRELEVGLEGLRGRARELVGEVTRLGSAITARQTEGFSG